MDEPLRIEDLPPELQDLMRWCEVELPVIYEAMRPGPWLPEENWAQREKRFLDAAMTTARYPHEG